MKPYELREITVNEYELICQGYQVRLQRERDNFRWSMWTYIRANSKKNIKITELMKLDLIDKQYKKDLKPLTAEQLKAIDEKFKLPEQWK